jgi:hypothetical protein
VVGVFKTQTMLTILFAIALDTTPLRPIPVLLPGQVQSETTKPKQKQNDKDKNHKTGDADLRILGRVNLVVVGR